MDWLGPALLVLQTSRGRIRPRYRFLTHYSWTFNDVLIDLAGFPREAGWLSVKLLGRYWSNQAKVTQKTTATNEASPVTFLFRLAPVQLDSDDRLAECAMHHLTADRARRNICAAHNVTGGFIVDSFQKNDDCVKKCHGRYL
jgi:hypothetical protein